MTQCGKICGMIKARKYSTSKFFKYYAFKFREGYRGSIGFTAHHDREKAEARIYSKYGGSVNTDLYEVVIDSGKKGLEEYATESGFTVDWRQRLLIPKS